MRSYRFASAPHVRTPEGKYCRVNGGTIPPWKCARCRADHEHAYEVALLRLDRQANRGR